MHCIPPFTVSVVQINQSKSFPVQEYLSTVSFARYAYSLAYSIFLQYKHQDVFPIFLFEIEVEPQVYQFKSVEPQFTEVSSFSSSSVEIVKLELRQGPRIFFIVYSELKKLRIGLKKYFKTKYQKMINFLFRSRFSMTLCNRGHITLSLLIISRFMSLILSSEISFSFHHSMHPAIECHKRMKFTRKGVAEKASIREKIAVEI